MPELPEVEIMRRQLARRLRGHRIRRLEVRDPKLKLTDTLAGQKIVAIQRRAKFLIFKLSGGRHLLVHLRMTGWFEFAAPARWRLAIVTDGGTAYFADARRFGMVELVSAADLAQRLAGLGAEPLNGALDMTVLWRTKRPIKVALLDQRLVAGVGNIYASEALWRARLSPRRRADKLTRVELRRLQRGIVAAMRKAIAYGPRIFAVQTFAVYDRAGQPCRRCGGTVRRIIQAQRSTFYCPDCQC